MSAAEAPHELASLAHRCPPNAPSFKSGKKQDQVRELSPRPPSLVKKASAARIMDSDPPDVRGDDALSCPCESLGISFTFHCFESAPEHSALSKERASKLKGNELTERNEHMTVESAPARAP